MLTRTQPSRSGPGLRTFNLSLRPGPRPGSRTKIPANYSPRAPVAMSAIFCNVSRNEDKETTVDLQEIRSIKFKPFGKTTAIVFKHWPPKINGTPQTLEILPNNERCRSID